MNYLVYCVYSLYLSSWDPGQNNMPGWNDGHGGKKTLQFIIYYFLRANSIFVMHIWSYTFVRTALNSHSYLEDFLQISKIICFK